MCRAGMIIRSPSTRNHHRPRPTLRRNVVWCGGPAAATLQRVAIWASTRTASVMHILKITNVHPMQIECTSRQHQDLHLESTQNDVKLWEKDGERLTRSAGPLQSGVFFSSCRAEPHKPKKKQQILRRWCIPAGEASLPVLVRSFTKSGEKFLS